MPKIKITKVLSFSSEDPVHVASNLLNADPAKKWKCSSNGEVSASVVLQLESAMKICSIDVGNEHSSNVEILVGRSSTSLSDLQVLLATTSFMSPHECRQSTNVNKVRLFKLEDFSKPECDEKWDVMKIVCTQIFNKHVQYGLSFINVYSSSNSVTQNLSQEIGRFTLRPESPELNIVGSLFANRDRKDNQNLISTATAIREASSAVRMPVCKSPLLSALKESGARNNRPAINNDQSATLVKKERNRNDLMYSEEEEAPNAKIDALVAKKQKEVERRHMENEEKMLKEREKKLAEKEKKALENEKPEQNKKLTENRKNLTDSDGKAEDSVETSVQKKLDNNRTSDHKGETKRKQAGTTDTPTKKRKVETPKKRPPTKPFNHLLENIVFVISGIQNPDRAQIRSRALGMGAKYKGDWDATCTHLICAYVNTPKFKQVQGHGKIVTKKWVDDCYTQRKRLPWRRYCLDRDDNGTESEEEICEEIQDDSEADLQSTSPLKAQASTSREAEILPTFFETRLFFIDPNLSTDDGTRLRRYIMAYKGKIVDLSLDSSFSEWAASIVITSSQHVVELSENCPDGITFVDKDWIWECHNKQECVPPQDFVLT